MAAFPLPPCRLTCGTGVLGEPEITKKLLSSHARGCYAFLHAERSPKR